ncbi:MAG: SDR family oxidoreductase [Rhodospirillales bacterium]
MSPKTILITGASGGIGAACALQAAREGYGVAINYRGNAAAAEAVAQAARDLGARAEVFQGDVAKEADVARLFAEVDATFGPLGVLVNNAGILGPKARVEELSATRIKGILETNVLGAFLCAAAAVRRMAKRYGGQGGAIVNVSSVAATHGSPLEYVDYAASKGAMDSFTVGLAKELADEGVRVNCVRPGIIETEIHAKGGQPDRAQRIGEQVPMRRPGTAEEVAEAVLWVASDKASYMTGGFLDVSGGR